MPSILIASDIHGDAANCHALLSLMDKENFDRLLLLGDILYHGPRNPIPPAYDPPAVVSLLSPCRDRIICVRGNCDAEVDQMLLPFPIMDKTTTFTVDDHTWFAAHGHRPGADPTNHDLPPLPPDSIFLSGHTHVPVLGFDENRLLRVNPGSITFPKGGSVKGCATYRDGVFSLVSLDGRILQTINL